MKTKRSKPSNKQSKRKCASDAKPVQPRAAKTLYDLFKPFIGMIKDGPPDLARNHKLYASGEKKWK